MIKHDADSELIHETFAPINELGINPAFEETDPTGRGSHEAGAKLDAGKIRPSLVLGSFPHALWVVCEVGTYGANKYSDNGWQDVPNGLERYDDALLRHWLKDKMGEDRDVDTDILHQGHLAWNALAVLERMIVESKQEKVAVDDFENTPSFSYMYGDPDIGDMKGIDDIITQYYDDLRG